MNNIRYYNTPEYIFNDSLYRNYIAKYEGNIDSGVSGIEGLYLTPIDADYAIVTIRKDLQNNIIDFSILNDYKKLQGENPKANIIYIKHPELYKLQDISPIDDARVRVVQTDAPLYLTGKDVVVGIISTGIDYLSSEFMTYEGKTRINFIWDQTIENKNNINRTLPYGTEYSRDEINSAIDLFKQGKDPYTIVPSVDEIGHGTNMTGLIGATGVNPDLKGVAPDCEFCVVKLAEAIEYKEDFNIKIPIYDITSIVTAITRLYNYARESLKPMVIYLPLGTNSGNHKGDGIINEIIRNISRTIGIILVTGAGDEGDEGGHASGVIESVGDTETIELNISNEQKTLVAEIWVDLPNIMTLNVISPSGEDTGVIPVLINNREEFNFIFEKVSILVSYLIPEEITGDQLILVYFRNLSPGSWKLRLTGSAITDGVFNAWIPVKGITVGNTRFIPSDPYGTVTVPGDSTNVITAAAYNQNNNNALSYSGMAFRRNFIDVINIAGGGVNARVVAPDNKIAIVNGTSVSAAVTGGVCALLFQWGIIDKNFPYMYSQSMITFVVRGAVKRRGDIYPNPRWGYGMLDVFGIFQNMT